MNSLAKPWRGQTPEQRFWNRVQKSDGCWNWTGHQRHRYGYGSIQIDGREIYSHRHSWALHNGPIPDGMLVCHHCDNPKCVRPDHLFIGTLKDNAQDMVRKGRNFTYMRGRCGSRHPRARLTENQVTEIRSAAGRVSCIEFARRFGVSPSAVSMARRGVNWPQVDTPTVISCEQPLKRRADYASALPTHRIVKAPYHLRGELVK